ncbi:uncharacterized protein Pyn_05818 [Prunus yedoensis var. nudiflora]|uniref:Uncharacterized protein n=1 Tax=Prunus yedoensis var. nudiflora TaxID=2094558 RepID=A0A314YWT7_PRUYE|nr:uncharacterized protein Pyn_05818 [Prunus yedoensis var. nudiflora]
MNRKCSNFIIERFLPDATPLAASSALQLNVSQINSSNELCYPWNYPEPEACVSRTACRQSYSSRTSSVELRALSVHKLIGV